jgi:hypothetical protein
MNQRQKRIETSITIGHAEWRRVRRRQERPSPEPPPPWAQRQWANMMGLATAVWSRLTRLQLALVSLALGLFVGLVVLGWWLWPVQWDASQWTGAGYHNLTADRRAQIITNSAELFSYTLDQQRVTALYADWPTAAADICHLAAAAPDQATRLRYEALLYIHTGRLCQDQE